MEERVERENGEERMERGKREERVKRRKQEERNTESEEVVIDGEREKEKSREIS